MCVCVGVRVGVRVGVLLTVLSWDGEDEIHFPHVVADDSGVVDDGLEHQGLRHYLQVSWVVELDVQLNVTSHESLQKRSSLLL